MSATLWLLMALAPAQNPVTAQVERSLSAETRAFLRCFELERAEGGSVRLRFRVNEEGRATDAALEALAPDGSALTACLLRTLAGIQFPKETAGADVVYPIRYSEVTTEPAAPSASTEPHQKLAVEHRDGFFLMDDWWIVDKRGIGVSDLALTKAAGASAVEANLESKRSTFFTLAVVEAALAAGSFGVGAYGAFRTFDEPQNPNRPLHIGLAAGGGAVSITAGALALYHLIRALDVADGTPVWHHLDQTEAESLVDQANGG
ncbi:MAG: hypothetical protein U1E65_20900 [Myxococcota bacterium]